MVSDVRQDYGTIMVLGLFHMFSATLTAACVSQGAGVNNCVSSCFSKQIQEQHGKRLELDVF